MKSAVIISVVLSICFINTALADDYPPGDTDGNGIVNIQDAMYLINYSFCGGPYPVDFRASDTNNDCSIDISDAIKILYHILIPETGTLDYGCEHKESMGRCIYPLSKKYCTGTMTVEIDNHNLTINHHNTVRPSNLQYRVNYNFSNDTIYVTENAFQEDSEQWCRFNLSSRYYSLLRGKYVVVLVDPYGQIIGSEAIQIPWKRTRTAPIGNVECNSYEPRVSTSNTVFSMNSDTLVMNHHAMFNCNADFVILYGQEADTLRFFVVNTAGMLMTCSCYFHLTAEVSDLKAGEYVAEIYHFEKYYHEFQFDSRHFITIDY